MRHILLFDPLENLTIKKDSTLLLAHSLAEKWPTYVAFKKDLAFANQGGFRLRGQRFESRLDGFYLKTFEVTQEELIELDESCTLHMRLDPPVDQGYIRCLWLLKAWQDCGVKVLNSASGILKHNEKMAAYVSSTALPTYVGGSISSFREFVSTQEKQGVDRLIFKPLDLYQGMGVAVIETRDEDLDTKFIEACSQFGEAIVVQPFWPEISEGELRSIWFCGKELGTILKVPAKGSFLANIAQGAQFHQEALEVATREECSRIAHELQQDGVDWLAFDILGTAISEVNLTCPGLLVEVSHAMQSNLAEQIAELL